MENLVTAHNNARRGKRMYQEVMKVDADLVWYLKAIQSSLITGTFTTSAYTVFTKNDKGKSREIYKLPYFPDRIVQHALLQVMEPIWKRSLIKQTYQSIKGRGVHKALKDLKDGLTDNSWVVKVDLKKYYPSIDNDLLYGMLVKKIKCRRTKELIRDIVYSIQGVPIGNYTSQYFGNVYLSQFDRELRKHCSTYSRYCDDIVCLVPNKSQGHKVLLKLEEEAHKLRLVVKPCKQVWCVKDRYIDYLGYHISPHHTLVRQGIKEGYVKAVSQGDHDKMVGYAGWLKKADCHNLIRSTYESSSK